MASLNKELWYAVLKDDIHGTKAALDKGADPNYGDRFAGDFLGIILIAVKWSCPEIMKLLLDYGADVHTVDNVEDTALHLAAWGNNQEAIDILIHYNASPIKINKYGQTPYDVARREGHDLENLHDCQRILLNDPREIQDILQNDEMIKNKNEIIQSLETQLNQLSPWDVVYNDDLTGDEASGYTRHSLSDAQLRHSLSNAQLRLLQPQYSRRNQLDLYENQLRSFQSQYWKNQPDPSENQLPSLQSQYSMVSQESEYRYPNNKGRILLFNFTKFDNPKKNRTGAEEDNDIIDKTFRQFDGKYEIIICESYTTQQTLSTVQNLQQDESLKEVDSLVIFISSHGESRNVFYTRDGRMDINDLRSLLYETSNGCLYLKGKAKIIMANYCQGQAVEEPISTAVGEASDLSRISERGKQEREKKSVPRNMKTFFSTSDGVVAWRKSSGGNYFLQTFCKVLSREPGLELQQLIYKTNEEVEDELGCNSTFSEEGSRFNHFYF